MTSEALPPAGPSAGFARRMAGIRHAVSRSWPARLLAGGAVVKALMFLIHRATGGGGVVDAVDAVGSVAAIAGAVWLLGRLVARANRRLLWRVRRKLIISYVFIGVFPVLLVIVFFLVSGLIVFLNVASFLVANGMRNLGDEARFVAQTTVLEMQRGGGLEAARSVLDRKEATIAVRYGGASIAVIPTGPEPCAGPGATERTVGGRAGVLPSSRSESAVPPFDPVTAGPWAHGEPPSTLPAWVSCSGFDGLVGYPPRAHPGADDHRTEPVVIRAAALPETPRPRYAVIIDIPLNDEVKERLREETSVKLEGVTLIGEDVTAGETAAGDAAPASGGRTAGLPSPAASGGSKARLNWVAFLERTDWATGETGTRGAMVAIGVNVADIYDRLSAAQTKIRGYSFGAAILLLLLFVAFLFLVIEGVALIMGLALARSITGSIHSLFTGTELVRRGDFSHRIAVKARDQLGELADSFNSMTASIEDLLRQAAEKKRLEEELRIARAIQMSLLPRGPLSLPGLAITALCLPAREVGGDYYDVLRLDDRRVGILIADVSGKGTSAALYMAELKGLMLSLSQIHASPRELLVHANRIIRDNLDSRSFITMTYAVIDLRARTMTYARAGHTPLIYRADTGNGRLAVQVLVPDGMVLGLQLDDGRLFERLLVEATLPLGPGDLLMFYTDGISEAMNEQGDCFGDTRLGRIVEEHGDLPSEQLRERILREIEAFVGGASQHDDMTLILLKLEPLLRPVALGQQEGEERRVGQVGQEGRVGQAGQEGQAG